MKNEQVFNTKLEEAVEIRTVIQDVYRKKYERLKQFVKETLGIEKKHFKHLVDMYHYRAGGYPDESSPPKHAELIEKFCLMVRYFGEMGLMGQVNEEMAKHGVNWVMRDLGWALIKQERLHYKKAVLLQEAKGVRDKQLRHTLEHSLKNAVDFFEALKACMLIADQYQGAICQHSNEIKRDIAPQVEAETDVKKGDFTNTVMFSYRLNSKKIKPRHLDKIKEGIKSKVVTGGMQINKAKSVTNKVVK